MIAAINAFIGRIASLLAAFAAGWVTGVDREKQKQTESQLGAMRDAKNLKDRLANDPDFARDVRDKYR